MASHDQKRSCCTHFGHLDLRDSLVQLIMPLHDVAMMLAPIVLYDQKGHVASHLDCLGIRNVMVPLMMLSASHDADTSTNGII